MLQNFFSALVVAVMTLSVAHAQDAVAPALTVEQFEASLKYQTGKISLPNAIATLDLPANFRYLDPSETQRVLVDGWGNPPGGTSLGMIVPANAGVLSQTGWGVIVTYEADGHVLDDEADQINYDDLLKEMQEGVSDSNTERKERGFAAMTLVGWAEKPRYDKVSHKLYWAKEIKSADATSSSLNYNIRVLGREGVLVLNAVAGIDQLATIRQEMQQVTAFTEFTAGNRYADFNSKTDKTAEYGIAALVAGGVASKLGLFGKLLAVLLAFKKIILIGLGAAGIALFNFVRGRATQKVNLNK